MSETNGLHNEPYFSDVGVIGLTPERWESVWQGRHYILTHLARYFNVVWVNPADGWREAWVQKAEVRRQADGLIRPGFSVYQHGPLLPRIHRPGIAASFTMKRRLLGARDILKRKGCRTIILYVWRPELANALELIDHDLSCYHIDDEYTFSEVETPTGLIEAKVISQVNQVFIHSGGLLQKKGHLNPHTMLVPNGVDFTRYATPYREPDDMKEIRRPRIGYTGVLKKQLDWELLDRLSIEHPDWSFLFIGPVSSHDGLSSTVERLSKRRNVFFLGYKSVADLTAYPQHFDVCIMPYRIDGYTKYIYPLKLHEYLASGRPVVGSHIDALQEFDQVISLAQTAEEWSRAISGLLDSAASSAERVEARRRIARKFDWNILVRLIARTLCERLGPSYLDRFGSLPVEDDVRRGEN